MFVVRIDDFKRVFDVDVLFPKRFKDLIKGLI